MVRLIADYDIFLQIALTGKVLQSVMSVRLFVFTLAFEIAGL